MTPKESRSPGSRLPRAQRRASLVEAGREVFLEEGFDGARTRLIAARAGINEAVLYQHFESKEELFRVAVLEPLAGHLHAMGERLKAAVEAGDPDDRPAILAAIEHELLRSLKEMVPLLGVALFSSRAVAEHFYRDEMYPHLAQTLVEITERLGWPDREQTTRVLAAMISMSLGPVLDAHFRSVRLNAGKTAKQLATLLVYGLANPPTAAHPGTRRTG